MVCTLQEEWQVMHCRKNNRVSLFRIVSGDLEEIASSGTLKICYMSFISY